jgi:hypothetical protein
VNTYRDPVSKTKNHTKIRTFFSILQVKKTRLKDVKLLDHGAVSNSVKYHISGNLKELLSGICKKYLKAHFLHISSRTMIRFRIKSLKQ